MPPNGTTRKKFRWAFGYKKPVGYCEPMDLAYILWAAATELKRVSDRENNS